MHTGALTNLTGAILRGSRARSNAAVKQATERLSAGKRINRASDDLAGDLEVMREAVRGASERISATRAAAGALMSRNQSTTRQWMAEVEATTGELSRIEDTDDAVEVSHLVRGQILQQASIWSLARQQAQTGSLLSLLR
ncbi:MAG: hypothetical protein DYG94_09185 [Leptolyngbya sp. PLA3]|nr:MAG: hypothetical protein EDM82_12150 [Cyanobacteria bacterium CYA]MCE7968905.1 hypothetical protein [Leptolyngbya sp. PL-A3]